MDVKIGVVYTAKEIIVEVDQSSDEVQGMVDDALRDDGGVLWLTDKRGRHVGIPADKLAYVEFGEDEARQVGFGR